MKRLASTAARLLAPLSCALALVSGSGAQAAEPPAAGASQSSCVAQGMDPGWRGTGVQSARQLVRSCLVTSPPAAGLCEGVPPNHTTDVLASEAWVIKGCANVGGPGYFCQELMAEVASYCHESAAIDRTG
jgi:hypothetical protein